MKVSFDLYYVDTKNNKKNISIHFCQYVIWKKQKRGFKKITLSAPSRFFTATPPRTSQQFFDTSISSLKLDLKCKLLI